MQDHLNSPCPSYLSFPETRTLPDGWDLSGMSLWHSGSSPESRASTVAECALLQAASAELHPDPFPEVKAWPSGWDLEAVLAAEREQMGRRLSGAPLQESAGLLMQITLPLRLGLVSAQ